MTSTANPDTLNAIVGYTGQVFDVETGLHYFKARYYDPASVSSPPRFFTLTIKSPTAVTPDAESGACCVGFCGVVC